MPVLEKSLQNLLCFCFRFRRQEWKFRYSLNLFSRRKIFGAENENKNKANLANFNFSNSSHWPDFTAY